MLTATQIGQGAPGPDEVPLEIFKEMDKEAKEYILEILNEWWTRHNMPDEVLQARVVLIF